MVTLVGRASTRGKEKGRKKGGGKRGGKKRKRKGAGLGDEGRRVTLGERGAEKTRFKDVKTFDVLQLVRFSIKSDFRRARREHVFISRDAQRGNGTERTAEYGLSVDLSTSSRSL